MAPDKKKKKKPKPPRGKKHPKPKPPHGKKQPKSLTIDGEDDSEIGGTINAIMCTLTFSIDATAVSIKVGPLESSVGEVQVYWNATQIYQTYVWDDPFLQAIPYACPPGVAALQVKLFYSGLPVAYRKPLIYPSPGLLATVTLTKV